MDFFGEIAKLAESFLALATAKNFYQFLKMFSTEQVVEPHLSKAALLMSLATSLSTRWHC